MVEKEAVEKEAVENFLDWLGDNEVIEPSSKSLLFNRYFEEWKKVEILRWKMNEIEQIIKALDVYEYIDDVERGDFLREFDKDKEVFLIKSDVPKFKAFLKKAIKQLESGEIKLVEEE